MDRTQWDNFFWKLTLTRTSDVVRPTRRGPDPNWPAYGSKEGLMTSGVCPGREKCPGDMSGGICQGGNIRIPLWAGGLSWGLIDRPAYLQPFHYFSRQAFPTSIAKSWVKCWCNWGTLVQIPVRRPCHRNEVLRLLVNSIYIQGIPKKMNGHIVTAHMVTF